jgi:hypothetical protein
MHTNPLGLIGGKDMAKQMPQNNTSFLLFVNSIRIEFLRQLSIFTQLRKIPESMNRPISRPIPGPVNQINNIDIDASDSLDRIPRSKSLISLITLERDSAKIKIKNENKSIYLSGSITASR